MKNGPESTWRDRCVRAVARLLNVRVQILPPGRWVSAASVRFRDSRSFQTAAGWTGQD